MIILVQRTHDNAFSELEKSFFQRIRSIVMKPFIHAGELKVLNAL